MPQVSKEFKEATKKELQRLRQERATEITPQARQNYIRSTKQELDKIADQLNALAGSLLATASNDRLGFGDQDMQVLARAGKLTKGAQGQVESVLRNLDRIHRA